MLRFSAWMLTVMLVCGATHTGPAVASPIAVDIIAEMRPLITTAGNPNDYVVSPGDGLEGVADLSIFRSDRTFRCTGTLLPTGQHVLTAAHCLTNDNGANVTSSVRVTFERPSGDTERTSTQFAIHENWTGEFSIGYDIAIVTLSSTAPVDVPRHDIYRSSDEVGQVGLKTGYGRSGSGDDGDTISRGTKRSGENRYDALGDVFDPIEGFDPVPGAQLAFDFDTGSSSNDAFGYFDSELGAGDLSDLGLGSDEVLSAEGDSGGPTIINGLVAGVTSYGLRLTRKNGPPPRTSDVDNELNSSFGEFGIDTRVSFFADWVDDLIGVPVVPSDMDCDGDTDFDDTDEFVLALRSPDTYEAIFGIPPSVKGDIDGDDDLDFDDVDEFVALLVAPIGSNLQTIPEPCSLHSTIIAVGLIWRFYHSRRSDRITAG